MIEYNGSNLLAGGSFAGGASVYGIMEQLFFIHRLSFGL